VGSTRKHWEPSNNLFPHLYKKRCFCMYQDVVIHKQRLVCELSNISRNKKKRSSSVQSNTLRCYKPPPNVVVILSSSKLSFSSLAEDSPSKEDSRPCKYPSYFIDRVFSIDRCGYGGFMMQVVTQEVWNSMFIAGGCRWWRVWQGLCCRRRGLRAWPLLQRS
jgi:hypothetical protein